MKTIAFIIPCHNEEKRIIKSVEKLEKVKIPRGFKLHQVILVDNGSRDKTFERLMQLSQKYDKIGVCVIGYKQKMTRKNAVSEGLNASHSDINIVLSPTLNGVEKKLKKITPKVRSKKRKPPLVSVVMPVYNEEKYLPHAIESIMNQTYKRFELIIVDDCSNDTSLEIIKSYKRRYRAKIKLIRMEKNLNRGGDVCANFGIEAARGKYIARMDADDIASPQRLEKQVDFLEKNPRVFLLGSNAYVINKNGKVIGEKIEPTNPADIYTSYATFHPIIHPSTMIRRIFKKKKFSYQIEYSANNDYYTFFKLVCRGYIFVNLPEKLIYYRIHDKNDTFVNIKEKFNNTVKIRINMATNFNYRPSVRDVAINIAQGVLMFLPEENIKNLYLMTKGIVKPKALNLPVLTRFILPSSV